jgi:uncharacterized protein
MSVPCEVAVRCVLPVVRAMLAKELMAVNGLKQVEVAQLLSISQPAVSLYNRSIRGKAMDLADDKDIKLQVAKIARLLVTGDLERRELILMYCGVCKTIRSKGLLCSLHKTFDSSINVADCTICKSIGSATCF